MAQSMTPPLLQRHNDPISIRKTEERHVSTKSKAQTTTESAQTSKTIEQLNHETELEQIEAQIRALTANKREIKALRKTARQLLRETELSNVLVTRLTGRVRSHIKGGQPQEQALDAVFQQYRDAVVHALAQPTTDTSDESAS
jgi:hypothetical protein